MPILGASGSGKSSFVLAGLIPQLKKDIRVNWLIESFRPQSNPLQSLANSLKAWDSSIDVSQLESEFINQPDSLKDCLEKIQAQLSSNNRLLLIIDQFEEVYTLASAQCRQAFLQLLVHAIEEVPKFSVVLTMRADFLTQVLEFEPWGKLWQRYEPEFLLPLSSQELQNAIAFPANNRGVQFESGLVTKIVESVEGKAGYLPLLQFTLTQLWSLQKKGILSHDAYEKLGGVYSALVDYAEDVYTRLSAPQRLQTQKLFLQLIQVNQNSEATRRIVKKTDIQDWDLALHLTSERLLTTNRDTGDNAETIEIVHEALINNWRRLKDWIIDNEDFLRWQNRLNTALDEWENHNCTDGYLLHHAPLVEAQLWLDKSEQSLTSEQKLFINLSIDLCDRQEKAEIERREKELQQERKIRRSAQKLAVISSLALFMVTIAGGWTWWERQRSMKIIETVSLASRGTTVDLLRDLPRFLNIAQRRQKSGETDIALAYYQKILTEVAKLQIQAQQQPNDFNTESLTQLKSVQQTAEKSMIEILEVKLIPSLETSLKNQQIGNLLSESNLLDYENQYSEGALKTTYTLLATIQGANADVNQDDEAAKNHVYNLEKTFSPFPSCYRKNSLPVDHTFRLFYY